MQAYICEVVYCHTAEDIDWRDVEAESRAEAQAVAETQFRRERYGDLRDVAIVSVTAEAIPERRYRLDLGSDRDDLDLEEVIE